MIKNQVLFVKKTSVIEMNSILRSAILFNSSLKDWQCVIC